MNRLTKPLYSRPQFLTDLSKCVTTLSWLFRAGFVSKFHDTSSFDKTAIHINRILSKLLF